MTDEPILVLSGGTYFSMIDTDGTNGVLVSQAGVITIGALTGLTVVDPKIFVRSNFANNNPPHTP